MIEPSSIGARSVAAAALAVLGPWLVGCTGPEASGSLSAAERFVLEQPGAEEVRWYQPSLAASGFTLTLRDRRIPTIIDMNGRVVHSWPEVQATGRVRLDGEGRLLVIGTDEEVREYDWSGGLLRTLPLAQPTDFPHHDLIQTAGGGAIVLAADRGRGDYLLEFDSQGKAVWLWQTADHRESFENWDDQLRNKTHINAIREIPPNRWFNGGDPRFRPGNLLVSARNLDTVFVIEKDSGEVVWQFSAGLDHQHEAVMLEESHPQAGNIIVFNNQLHSDARRTKVQILDPLAAEVVWEYSTDTFYSPTAGLAQPLPGGNIMIASSVGGRVFEITPDGQIVWEWAPAYLPMRPERLAYDHCPQLAALRPAVEARVIPENLEPFISEALRSFDSKDSISLREIQGVSRRVLDFQNGCRRIMVPGGAHLKLRFGFAEPAGSQSEPARFRISLTGTSGPVVVLDEVVDGASVGFGKRRSIGLRKWANQSVEACLSIDGVRGNPAPPAAFWGAPQIGSRHREPEAEDAVMSEEELRIRRRHLEMMGYVN